MIGIIAAATGSTKNMIRLTSTLYPPKKVDCNPEFSAEQSAFSTEEFDDDRYSLEYQRANADAPPDPSPPAESTPSEAIDTEEEWISLYSPRYHIEQRQRGRSNSQETARE
jgi:hypothetical protein